MANMAIMRTQKHRSKASVGGIGDHMNRAVETPNADPACSDQNRTWTPENGWRSWFEAPPVPGSQVAALDARLDEFRAAGGKVQKNAVQVVELLLGASPEVFKDPDFRLDDWAQAQIDWLHKEFGKSNVLEAVLHLDETTPHIHALVFPQVMRVDNRGGDRRSEARHDAKGAPERAAKPALAAAHWLNGSKRLSELQTNYAQAMKPFGLERGQERSRAKHQTIKQFYGSIERIERAAKIPAYAVSSAVDALLEPRMVCSASRRDEQKERQRRLAEVATKLHKVAKAREQQALSLRVQLEAVQGRYEGLERLVGGADAAVALAEAVQARNDLQRALEELRSDFARDRESLRSQMQADIEHWKQHAGELRSDFARERDSLRSQMQADIEHWKQHAGELQVRVESMEDKEQELREWGRGWREHARDLERELYGEPDSGPRLG